MCPLGKSDLSGTVQTEHLKRNLAQKALLVYRAALWARADRGKLVLKWN